MLATAMAVVTAPLQAQTLTGTVRDGVDRTPLRGAVVEYLDSLGASQGRTLTNDRGQFQLLLRPAIQRVQVLRIGFRSQTLAIPTAVDGRAVLEIVMERISTVLDPVRVAERSDCSVRKDRRAALELWQQARAGLLAVVASRATPPAHMVRLGFDRNFAENSDRVLSQRVTIDSARGVSKPFGAVLSGAEFARHGFTSDQRGTTLFYAPDVDVLLDDAFAGAYCFHVMEAVRERPHQIGLGFAVAKRKSDRVDVDGALWIDTVARALRDIEFRYVGADPVIAAHRMGGRIAFREMDNGAVVIDRWTLRLVAMKIDTVRGPIDRPPIIRRWGDVRETGGELASARWPDGLEWKASLGTLRVKARTGTGAPAVGAKIQLDETDYRATVDSNGEFEIANLLPGPYSAIVIDTLLAPLGITLSTPLKFVAARDSVQLASLEVPTAEDYVARACQADKKPPTGTAWILARVTDEYGNPVDDARWQIQRKIDPFVWQIVAENGRTGTSGIFQLCSKLELRSEPMEVQLKATVKGASTVVYKKLTTKLTVVQIRLKLPR